MSSDAPWSDPSQSVAVTARQSWPGTESKSEGATALSCVAPGGRSSTMKFECWFFTSTTACRPSALKSPAAALTQLELPVLPTLDDASRRKPVPVHLNASTVVLTPSFTERAAISSSPGSPSMLAAAIAFHLKPFVVRSIATGWPSVFGGRNFTKKKFECADLSRTICFVPLPSKSPTAASSQSEFVLLPSVADATIVDTSHVGFAFATTRSGTPVAVTVRTATISSYMPPSRFAAATARQGWEALDVRSPAPTANGAGPRRIEKLLCVFFISTSSFSGPPQKFPAAMSTQLLFDSTA